MMSDNGKRFTLEELFRSPELLPSFPFDSIKNFSKFSGWAFTTFFLLLNYIIVYFIYLRSKAAVSSCQFSFQFFLKFSNCS